MLKYNKAYSYGIKKEKRRKGKLKSSASFKMSSPSSSEAHDPFRGTNPKMTDSVFLKGEEIFRKN